MVDAILRGRDTEVEERWFDEDGEVRSDRTVSVSLVQPNSYGRYLSDDAAPKRIFPSGIDRSRLERVARRMQLPVTLVDTLSDADLLMITKNHYQKNRQALEIAEASRIPVYVLRSNTLSQIEQGLVDIYDLREPVDSVAVALREAEQAVSAVKNDRGSMELSPQNSFIRRLQHQLVEKYGLKSESTGKDPRRRVRVFGELF
ncbi:MAG: hypothetical protein DDT27_01052 [Dehalococcoidia bacterium]|nr:hypothetical protein [Chloroflexota bacterium]